MEQNKIDEILNSNAKKNEKNYRLHLGGLTPKQISEITKQPASNISRDIWGYKIGRTKLNSTPE